MELQMFGLELQDSSVISTDENPMDGTPMHLDMSRPCHQNQERLWAEGWSSIGDPMELQWRSLELQWNSNGCKLDLGSESSPPKADLRHWICPSI